MSISFWAATGFILLLCGYLFKKTVSDDAKNDFRLRDIISNSSVHSQKTLENKDEQAEELVYTNTATSANKNLYEEKKESNSYSTNIHEGTVSMSSERTISDNCNEKSYYQKDRYMVTDKVGTEQKVLPEKPKEIPAENAVYSKDLTTTDTKKEHIPVIHKKGMLYYTRVFWKGVTFALGLPALCYGLFSFVTNAPTVTEKLMYSIWILLGVILVK